jgi:hypothetical protein
MQPWQIHGLDQLERSGYMSVLRNLVRSHTCPFWWFDDHAPMGSSIIHNGTISFVDTGNTIVGVTANHVYQQYLHDKATRAATICQIGNVTAEPERYLVSADAALDMAVFEFPSVLLAGTGVTVHHAAAWPPQQLQATDLVVLGGYPGNRRGERPPNAEFDFVTLVSRVSQCSDDHASVYLNMPHSYWPQGVAIGDQPDLGGISGGPVFRLRTEPIEMVELVGMIYEASREYELIFSRHISRLSEAGALLS